MSKRATECPPIFSTVGKLRPSTATHYRLVDSQNRLFPPRDQPGYHAKLRVDPPSVPPGIYGIHFEDLSGDLVPYTEDGAMEEIRLDGSTVTDGPEDLEIRRERGYQKVEKREHRFREQATRNDGLAGLMRLLIESQAHAAERDRSTIKMVKLFTKGQKQLLKQQNALFKQSAHRNPAPSPENWPSAAKAIVDSLGKVISTAVVAYGDDRRPQGQRVLDAVLQAAALGPGRAESDPTRLALAAPAPKPPTSPLEPPQAEVLSSGPMEPAPPVPIPPTSLVEVAPLRAEEPRPELARAVALSRSTAPPGSVQTPQAEAAHSLDLDLPRAKNQAPLREPISRPAGPLVSQARSAPREDDPKPRPTATQVAWRDIKRRILHLPDGGLAEVFSNRESLVEWLRWVAEPAEISPAPA